VVFLRQECFAAIQQGRQKMPKAPTSLGGHGPAIRALDPWTPSGGRMRQLLTDDERARLAVMSTIVRFNKGEVIY
jgi:hypothetical protein